MAIMFVNHKECKAAGLDAKEVERIARGLSRYAKQAEALDLEVFGGSGNGTLRFQDDASKGGLLVADLDGPFDGGAGYSEDWGDGLLRGE